MVVDQVHESFIEFLDLLGWLYLQFFDGNIYLFVYLFLAIPVTECCTELSPIGCRV